jgi:GNAT superfamily N-acetyltransferase
MIRVRTVESSGDLETWAQLKSAVVPNEPVTADQLRANDEEGRLLVLAELDGAPAGCGVAALSHFAGRVFVAPRVLPAFRGRGIGAALFERLVEHARSLGRDGLIALVDAAEPASIAFAERCGLEAVDYQLQQRRLVGDEPEATPPDGVELVPLGERREELLRAVWPFALESYAEVPFEDGDLVVTFEEWLRDEATRPEGSFAAFEAGEPVGYAGLLEHADGAAAAEHGFTVVRRDRRGRGIARALKRAQLRWAAANGVVELVTWTQKGNDPMQALNRSLGYADVAKAVAYHGPLP